MLDSLSKTLRKGIEKITRLGIVDKEAVEDLIRDIQRSLLSSDVDVQLVYDLSERVRKRAFEKLPPGLSRKEHIVKVVYEELTNTLGKHRPEITLKPKRILLVGLYGSGKTTTSAKLARFYQRRGLKPVLICCDVVRPAAYEQLQQLAQQIDVLFYGEKDEKDARKVLKNGLERLRGDVFIVDSSGRSGLDKDLIEEIKSLNDILKPDERILVIPADIGQAAKEQAEAFHSALGITDVIVTKLDATAKGGGAIAACAATGSTIKFITKGETPDDIQVYDPEKFVARLLGFPDLGTLLEKAKAVVDEKKAKKIAKGDFDLEDFYEQFKSMQKMGPLSQVVEMMGLGSKVPKQALNVQQEKIKKWEYIIQSMTKEERAKPSVINASRIRRIAKGSGCSETDVRELLSNYNKTKKLMKKLSPKKLQRGGMGNLLRRLGVG
jgi:signal recognition particle subunit SRP54